MINAERLTQTFMELVRIDSISKEEGRLSKAIQDILKPLGAKIFIDETGQKIGGETGNLIARFIGNRKAPPFLLNAHMDTVEPAL